MTRVKIFSNEKNVQHSGDESTLLEDKPTQKRRRGALTLTFIILSLALITAGLTCHVRDYFKSKELLSSSLKSDKCFIVNDAEKFDCYPQPDGSEEKCNARGCCWKPAEKDPLPPLDVPWCFYPLNYSGYEYINVTSNDGGIIAFLNRTFPSTYPEDVNLLQMNVEFQTDQRLRIKIFDPLHKRYEPPYPELKAPSKTPPKSRTYQVDVREGGFAVKRPNGDILFDTRGKGAFIFANQFLQLSAQFRGNIYGLGEHRSTFRLDTNWNRLTMLNRDIVPLENMNLYGSHPFYLALEPSGTAHGVFLLNSNAMDVLLQPLPAITFRTIGGVLDFYFFTGPSPADVVKQYVELVGKPTLPPYWSLGFHICRYGYKNVTHVEAVLNRTLEAGIPVDTQWVDIDYMVDNNDFTLNNASFGDLPALVDRLHNHGMHFVPILDPGVSAGEPQGSYEPFDEGMHLGIFVKNQDGSVFIGKVWNKNSTVYPDFTDRRTFVYWTGLIHKLHERIPFDGLWIDMNEPSNFLDGTLKGCPNNSLEYPPYLPGARGEKLSRKTICMSAVHALGPHYNVHNLYGISEAHATNRALKEIIQTRPFIISRSTFSGIGHYSGHWSGDVASTWHDMKSSISEMLSFSVFGVPMMGADICGFNGNTTKYLCLRWSQLGAFYPFSRNHNTDNGIDQDPVALGVEVAEAAKKALTVRYALLPYLYTLFWRAHTFGETVARPVFFEFPEDENTHSLDESFLWGCCLLIVPVLKEYATTVDTYLPAGRWYDWYSNMGSESSGGNTTLHASTDNIPILIRGGAILPTQEPALNTVFSRSNKLSLIAGYDSHLSAEGSLYWDDGESLHVDVNKTYGLVEFSLTPTNLTSQVSYWGVKQVPVLGAVKILGFVKQIKQVFLNGTSNLFTYNSTSLVLSLEDLNIAIDTPFIVTWS